MRWDQKNVFFITGIRYNRIGVKVLIRINFNLKYEYLIKGTQLVNFRRIKGRTVIYLPVDRESRHLKDFLFKIRYLFCKPFMMIIHNGYFGVSSSDQYSS